MTVDILEIAGDIDEMFEEYGNDITIRTANQTYQTKAFFVRPNESLPRFAPTEFQEPLRSRNTFYCKRTLQNSLPTGKSVQWLEGATILWGGATMRVETANIERVQNVTCYIILVCDDQ